MKNLSIFLIILFANSVFCGSPATKKDFESCRTDKCDYDACYNNDVFFLYIINI